jgi:hypothetical protein
MSSFVNENHVGAKAEKKKRYQQAGTNRHTECILYTYVHRKKSPPVLANISS